MSDHFETLCIKGLINTLFNLFKLFNLICLIQIWQAYNPGHNILEFYSVLVQVQFATSKTKLLISSITNLV